MKKRPGLLWLMVAVFLMGCLGAVNALAWPVPDTGQTTCYDNFAILTPCPASGGAFYGQDASYTINPMSYTKLDADGTELPDGEGTWSMVRDNVTGLVWENKQALDGKPNYANPMTRTIPIPGTTPIWQLTPARPETVQIPRILSTP